MNDYIRYGLHIARTLTVAAAVISAASEGAPAKHKQIDPDAKLIAQARAATVALLRDPSSAQFRNIRIGFSLLGSKKVCGEVNAKNGFGGYSGFKPFVFFGHAAIASEESKDMLDYLSISSGC